jgi:hypothetical protein
MKKDCTNITISPDTGLSSLRRKFTGLARIGCR